MDYHPCLIATLIVALQILDMAAVWVCPVARGGVWAIHSLGEDYHPSITYPVQHESYNELSQPDRNIDCSDDLTSRTFGAGIEFFGAVFSLLNGGLSSELEQFDKKVSDRA